MDGHGLQQNEITTMCGIFGLSVGERSTFSPQQFKSTLHDLFRLSESRGKEAAGLAIHQADAIHIFKSAISATELLRNKKYQSFLDEALSTNGVLDGDGGFGPLTVIGHSRLVTNGSMESHGNNQPIIKEGVVGIHNGIVVNDNSLWNQFAELERAYDVDTEIILTLVRKHFAESQSLSKALHRTFQDIKGTASVALLFEDLNTLALATNNGSLYTCSNASEGIHIFASERYILQTLLRRSFLHPLFADIEILHIGPGDGLFIEMRQATSASFSVSGVGPDPEADAIVFNGTHKTIADASDNKETHPNATAIKNAEIKSEMPTILPSSVFEQFEIDSKPIEQLHRCTKCILPETMPFISFDEQGVCNYCRNYCPLQPLGEEALQAFVEQYRSRNGDPDCIVTFSGGRDSSYGVHYVKNVLKMNPITYTYDWGMVTDLARRNQARLCGELGIEHILVSADIVHKRNNIRKNVTAWLNKPDLGTIPLFMAGDKQYFYYANQLRKQTGVEIIILCENMLETTNFKSGYCGIPPAFGTNHTYTLSSLNKLKMAFYYARQYLQNPGYINSSILDTVGAFASYYIIPHNYLNLFDYLDWDEETIMSPLLDEYDWELAPDTNMTWRIGDGTAAFYNYIYFYVAGFTENDTFRSNQIREGTLSRSEALALAADENRPRFESLQWYCQTVGLDTVHALERIQSISKLY